MNNIILASPLLLALFGAALLCSFLTSCGKRLSVFGWLTGMISTVLLILAALLMEASLQEIVTMLTLLLAVSFLRIGRMNSP